ncbi:MAG: FAD:protein FMN transferase [Planctomycetes bacterium]|nr:FAD:protein FMN transferase [Planctomycetota bacterium]
MTGGAFDPTVGPYVRLWRRARRSGELPTQARMDVASAREAPLPSSS